MKKTGTQYLPQIKTALTSGSFCLVADTTLRSAPSHVATAVTGLSCLQIIPLRSLIGRRSTIKNGIEGMAQLVEIKIDGSGKARKVRLGAAWHGSLNGAGSVSAMYPTYHSLRPGLFFFKERSDEKFD